ncbi:MAG: hypothetical protein ACP5IT_11325 [Thermoproteota archaeon]
MKIWMRREEKREKEDRNPELIELELVEEVSLAILDALEKKGGRIEKKEVLRNAVSFLLSERKIYLGEKKFPKYFNQGLNDVKGRNFVKEYSTVSNTGKSLQYNYVITPKGKDYLSKFRPFEDYRKVIKAIEKFASEVPCEPEKIKKMISLLNKGKPSEKFHIEPDKEILSFMIREGLIVKKDSRYELSKLGIKLIEKLSSDFEYYQQCYKPLIGKKVFIAHKMKDISFVKALSFWFSMYGVIPIIGEEEAPRTGEKVGEKIKRLIDESDAVIVVITSLDQAFVLVSSSDITSSYFEFEVKYAQEKKKWVILIVKGEVVKKGELSQECIVIENLTLKEAKKAVEKALDWFRTWIEDNAGIAPRNTVL